MKIGLTNSKKMWMMIRYEVFNLNSFVIKIGIRGGAKNTHFHFAIS